jgi:hypothetical protein
MAQPDAQNSGRRSSNRRNFVARDPEKKIKNNFKFSNGIKEVKLNQLARLPK